jgi:hypothetical protein
VSVDTNTKGKNLAPYRTMRYGDMRILVSPKLSGIASSMRIDASGALRKRLKVELSGDDSDACAI